MELSFLQIRLDQRPDKADKQHDHPSDVLSTIIQVFAISVSNCGRPWPAAYINIIQNTHPIQVLTEALFRAQAIFYSLPNNEWGTKYRGLTYSAK